MITFIPLPDMPILGFSNPAVNKDINKDKWGYSYLIE